MPDQYKLFKRAVRGFQLDSRMHRNYGFLIFQVWENPSCLPHRFLLTLIRQGFPQVDSVPFKEVLSNSVEGWTVDILFQIRFLRKEREIPKSWLVMKDWSGGWDATLNIFKLKKKNTIHLDGSCWFYHLNSLAIPAVPNINCSFSVCKYLAFVFMSRLSVFLTPRVAVWY